MFLASKICLWTTNTCESYRSQYHLRTRGLRGQLDALCYWINALLFAVFRILAIYSFAFCLQRPRFCNCLLQVLFIKKIVAIRDASAEHEGPGVVYIYFLKLPRVELPCGRGCSLKYLSYVFDSEFCSLTIHKYINYSLNPLHCTSQVWLLQWQISRESSYRNRTQPQPETLVKNCKHKWKKIEFNFAKNLAIDGTLRKYCSVACIWMATPQVFIHRLKS